jgi:formylglycine-generating enzyme required for sulfatase activity
MRGHRLLALVVLLVLLVACAPAATPTPVPTPTPTVVPTPTPEPLAGATKVLGQTGITMVYVPAGEFTMGSTDAQIDQAVELCKPYFSSAKRSDGFDAEFPEHRVALDGYWIGQTEVTNAQYKLFIDAGGYSNREYWTDLGWLWKEGKRATQPQPEYWSDLVQNGPDYPVVGVSWYEASAYAKWAGARLPTEEEWEKAARGTDGRTYPWGNTWDGTRVNSCDKNCYSDPKDGAVDDGYATTSPVGQYASGASPYGALDLAGNVWEWVDAWYQAYPGSLFGSDYFGQKYRVARGGSWGGLAWNARCACRVGSPPDIRSGEVGFRVAE